MVNHRWNAICSWLWPGICPLCRARAVADTGEAAMCGGCRAALPWLRSACPRCATALTHPASGRPCGACQRKAPPFDGATSALRYDPPIDRLVLDLKYHRRLDYARLLGTLLAGHLRASAAAADVIVPVPLHAARLRERGYNQSLEIARVIARRLNIPLAAHAARRVRATPAQAALPLARRARNVRNAFAIREDLRDRRVAIVDDVMTSGHTVGALAKALRRAGAKEVSVWIVARA